MDRWSTDCQQIGGYQISKSTNRKEKKVRVVDRYNLRLQLKFSISSFRTLIFSVIPQINGIYCGTCIMKNNNYKFFNFQFQKIFYLLSPNYALCF